MLEQLRIGLKAESHRLGGPGAGYAFGSSIVTTVSIAPKLVRRKRSVVRSASVWGWPSLSSQLPSLKPAVVTTNVSPSHCPTE